MTKLGQFRVKEEDEGASSLRPGALFFSRINKTPLGECRKPESWVSTGWDVGAWASRRRRLGLDFCSEHSVSRRVEAGGPEGPDLILDPLSPSVATASDPAGPSYAAATLQASSAASSAAPASRALGSISKVGAADPGGVEKEERSSRTHLIPPSQPPEPPKGKRKLDLNQEERKTSNKPSAQPSPPALKRPKREQTGFLVTVGARAPVS